VSALGFPLKLALKASGGNEPLNFRGLKAIFFAVFLDLTADDGITDIVFLGEVEELPDVVGSLRPKSARLGGFFISETLNVLLTLFDDDEVEDGKVVADDATTDRLPLPLTSLSRSVALGSLLEEKTAAVVEHDTLHHREALLIVATRDSEDVSLPIISEDIPLNFLRHALVVKMEELLLIFDFDDFLASRCRACDVKLHG